MGDEKEKHSEPVDVGHQISAYSKGQGAGLNKVLQLRIVITELMVLAFPLAALYVYMNFTVYDFAFFGTIAVLLAVIALVSLVALIWTVPHRRRAMLISLASLFICVGALSIDYVVTSQSFIDQDEDTRVPDNLNQNIQMERYRPFTSTDTARLLEPSTLVFEDTDQMPNIDSESALFPLESAIVTAVYPESASVAPNITDPGHRSDVSTFASLKNYDYPYDENGEIPDDQRIDWDVQFNESWDSLYALSHGYTDIFLGTKPRADQLEESIDESVPLTYTTIGQEAFVFIVNSSNPVDSLTSEQLRGIYSGEITNWREVGGSDEEIVAFQRVDSSNSQSRMERFMEDTPLADAPEYRKVETKSGLVGGVADYQNGEGSIGYSLRYYVTDLVDDYDVKLLAVDGVEPILDNIENGTYPLTGDIVAITRKGESNPLVGKLLDWIRGTQGQELMHESGYAGLSSRS